MKTFQISDREWIKASYENEPEVTVDIIKTVYNCREAGVDGFGSVWIKDPQTYHWLDDTGVAKIVSELVGPEKYAEIIRDRGE